MKPLRRSKGRIRILIACLAAVSFAPFGLVANASSPSPTSLSPEVPLADLQVVLWDSSRGLPINAVLRVAQDRDGFLWLATYEGLVRFDGRTFEIFDHRTLPTQTDGFGSLAEDEDETLWVGSQDGFLIRRVGAQFVVENPDAPLGTTIHRIVPDGERIFLSARNHGLYVLEDGVLGPSEHAEFRGVQINDVLRSASGELFIATDGRGLFRLDDDGTPQALDAEARPRFLHEAPDGALWIGGAAGLARLTPEGVVAVEGTQHLAIDHLLGDSHGSLWLAAASGLYRYADGRLEGLTFVADQPLRDVLRLAFDHEGNLWAATTTLGLLQLKTARFQNFGRAQGLPTDRVNVVFEDGDRILVGNQDGTVSAISENRVEALVTPESLPSSRVRDVYRDRSGALWILSYRGAVQIVGEGVGARQRRWTPDDGLPTDQVRFVFEDRADRIHFGTRDAGLVRFDPEAGFPAIDRDDGLLTDYLLDVHETRNGDLYLAGQTGLSLVRGGRAVRSWKSGEDLPGSLVFHVGEDDRGDLWLATNAGVARLRGDRVDRIDAPHLPNGSIYDIQSDATGAFWLSSSAGVFRAQRNDLEAAFETDGDLEYRLFDEHDGMISHECTGATGFLQTEDGRLWFPTMKGAAVIDPRRLPRNEIAPPIRLRRIWVDGAEETPVPGQPLILPPGAKRLSLDFSVLSFQSPRRARARYRLEGFDDQWIDADAYSATYTQLQPGDYAFHLLGANGDGVWSAPEIVLRVKQEPFFYQRPSFVLAVVALLGAAIFAAHRWRVAGIRAYVEELHRAEAENRRLIEKLAASNTEITQFATAVSHDLRSPLVTIQGLLGFVGKDLQKGAIERAQEDLQRVNGAAAVMGRRLDDLSRLSKAGRLDKTFETVDMNALAAQAIHLVQGRALQADAEIRCSENLPEAYGDPDRLLEVFQNLLDNAIKFRDPQRRPGILIDWNASTEEYFVRDNGRGIAEKDQEKVFGLFDRLDGDDVEGTGVGLAMVRRIVEVHGGRIRLESAGPGHGTAFFFRLARKAPE